jgi:hypothetical protein
LFSDKHRFLPIASYATPAGRTCTSEEEKFVSGNTTADLSQNDMAAKRLKSIHTSRTTKEVSGQQVGGGHVICNAADDLMSPRQLRFKSDVEVLWHIY